MIASFGGPIEFSPVFAPRPRITHAVFDFDGTLSWLRHGWPDIMVELFRKHLALKSGETEHTLHELLLDDVLSLNGKPSIHQMIRGVERIKERGGSPIEPEELLQEYQHRLEAAIRKRTAAIASGRSSTEDFIIFGGRNFLDKLRHRGLILIILSGTAEAKVKEEARLLKIAEYFGSHIYGSTPDTKFSKRGVLDRLFLEENIVGENLLSFGDGPVEIQHTKELGGLAVAVASDEEVNGSGRMHPQKRRQLLVAGGDVLIPDYRDADALTDCLFQK
jgi:phosphoglycolate phosphatase-like HAD superfamily hydrolase